jgi:hypothetical protein
MAVGGGRKRGRRSPARGLGSLRAAVLACVAVVVVAATAVGGAFAWRAVRASGPGVPRAVIVDQLALTDPNPGFVEGAAHQLQAAGYRVDYVPADRVTVNFYRDLPKRGYDFIVLRTHTSDYRTELTKAAEHDTPQRSIGLFTNERYSRTTHLDDQYAKRLMIDSYADRPIKDTYFGITPEFITESTHGRFDGATVVLMGCSGLETNDLAQAFLGKGAKEFVSWDRPVTAEHTDAATSALLTNLFAGGLELREAVAKTMGTVGSDPAFGAKLAVFP